MRRPKGREQPGFMPLKEAAKKLRMSPRSVLMLLTSGQLAGYQEGRYWYCSIEDLERVQELSGNEATAESAQRMAGAALAVAKQAMNQVQELIELLGLEAGQAPATEQEAKLWLLEMTQHKTQAAAVVQDAQLVKRWAKTFLAMTEHFLGWLEDVTADQNMWAQIHIFSRTLVQHADRLKPQDEVLRRAHYLLRTGDRVVRASCFFYLCHRNGANYAARFFPESKGRIDNDLVSILLEQDPQVRPQN
jgi:hypothetical protein